MNASFRYYPKQDLWKWETDGGRRKGVALDLDDAIDDAKGVPASERKKRVGQADTNRIEKKDKP
jgi:hypothetical protein